MADFYYQYEHPCNGATTPYHPYLNLRCKDSKPHSRNFQRIPFPGVSVKTTSLSFPGIRPIYS